MRQPFSRLFPLVILLALFTGCTIEKRLYTKGWSVAFHRHYRQAQPEKELPSFDASSVRSENAVAEKPSAASLPERENLHPITTADEPFPVAANDPVPVVSSIHSQVAAAEDTIPLKENVGIPEKTKNAKKPYTEERKRASAIAASVLMLLSILGILFLLGTLAGGAAIGTELALLGLMVLLIGVTIVSFFLLLAAATREVVYEPKPGELPPPPKKERSPEEAARIKKRGLIFLGLLLAVVVGGIVIVSR